jgi:hypothetical protein
MTKDEALKMAIEALEQAKEQLEKYWDEDIKRGYYIEEMDDSPILLCGDTINACKEALNIANCDLKQPAQEPYAWATEWEDGEWSISHSPSMGKQSIPLYPHSTPDSTPAIEQALKDKNT